MNVYVKNLIKKHKVISFDIFDTLLVRPYVKPENVFQHLEKIYQAKDFFIYRSQAEEVAQKEYNKISNSYEEIYSVLPKEYAFLKDIEYSLEKETLFIHKQNMELFNYAKKLNKKIIIVSDMYYSSKQLDEILKSKEITGYDKIYVSSEWNAVKWNGSLWPKVLNDLNNKASDILHIGDTLFSDVIAPKKNGINSYHVMRPIENFFSKHKPLQKLYKENKNDLSISLIIGLLVKRFINIPDFTSYWKKFGYTYGGPICYGLTKWLSNQIIVDNIKEVAFIARDGYTIKRIFDILLPNIKSHYVYAPRSVNLITSLNYHNDLPWTNKLLSIIKLYSNILPEFKKKIKKDIDKLSRDEQLCLINENHTILNEKSNLIFQKYSQYIENLNINEHKIGLFDISGGGFNSLKLISKVLPEKNIKGYYWLTIGDEAIKSNLNVTSYQKDFSISFSEYNILEFLITAPEFPISFFDTDGNLVRIQNKYEKVRISAYKEISDAEIEFTKDLINTFNSFTVDLSWDTLVKLCNVFVKKAKFIDYWNFKNIKHGMDEAHTVYVPVLKRKYHVNKIFRKFKTIFHKK